MSQLIINSVIAASEIALVGIGFFLIYRTARFIHFTQAFVIALGAYLSYVCIVYLGISRTISVIISIFLCGMGGALMELLIYRPLRSCKTSSSILLLVSLGLYIIGQNIISLFFGDDVLGISDSNITVGIDVFGAKITPIRVLILLVTILTIFLLTLFLRLSRIGKSIRAVGNNPYLADVVGINSDKVILISFIVGSALAGLVGVLLSFDFGMRPMMGINPLIVGIVAVIIAGSGNVWGISVSAFIIALVQQLVVWHLGAQWQEASTFAIILVVLLLRPNGLFGRYRS